MDDMSEVLRKQKLDDESNFESPPRRQMDSSEHKQSRQQPNSSPEAGYETPAELSDDPSFLSTASSSSSTHDTSISSFHYPSIGDLTNDLQCALNASWKSRNDPNSTKYKIVKAFLLSWEDDDLGVETEVDKLGDLFERVYSYQVEKWKIPSGPVDVQDAVDEKVKTMIKEFQTPSSLLIFYYAGHAQPQEQIGSYPVWRST